MKHKVLLTIAAGTTLAITAIQTSHALEKSPAYVINEVDVTDPARFKAYIDKMTPLVTAMDGKVMVIGGKTEAPNGAPSKRVTLLVFDSNEKMEAWRHSAAAQEMQMQMQMAQETQAPVAQQQPVQGPKAVKYKLPPDEDWFLAE